jgi:type IV pilus assembly protein PilO
MPRDFTFRRRAALGGVILLALADVALGLYSWELASAPRTPQQQLAAETKQLDLLSADIRRAQGIREKIPSIQKDCDKFEESLFPSSSGYSSVTTELGDIARKSGIRLDNLSFKKAEVANRNMTEVAVDATINGDYKGVIEFLNGLQRSTSLYEVDSLALATQSTTQAPSGTIKVSVHLKTYFRTA